jgi:hypothetical protein
VPKTQPRISVEIPETLSAKLKELLDFGYKKVVFVKVTEMIIRALEKDKDKFLSAVVHDQLDFCMRTNGTKRPKA